MRERWPNHTRSLPVCAGTMPRSSRTIRSRRRNLGILVPSWEALYAVPSPEAVEKQVELESIVMRAQRPVLAIRDNVTRLEFVDEADSEIWGERLTKARSLLDDAIRAVGRIDLMGDAARLGRHRLARRREHPRHQPPCGATNLPSARAKDSRSRWASTDDGGGRRLPSGDRKSREARLQARQSRCTSKSRRDPTSPSSRSRWSPATRSSPSRSISRPASSTTAERRDDRLSGLRQPHPRARADGAHLRQGLQQEAARARAA